VSIDWAVSVNRVSFRSHMNRAQLLKPIGGVGRRVGVSVEAWAGSRGSIRTLAILDIDQGDIIFILNGGQWGGELQVIRVRVWNLRLESWASAQQGLYALVYVLHLNDSPAPASHCDIKGH
jgi:hypothetical protein